MLETYRVFIRPWEALPEAVVTKTRHSVDTQAHVHTRAHTGTHMYTQAHAHALFLGEQNAFLMT